MTTTTGTAPVQAEIEARIDDLLERMTLDEKVGQLVQVDGTGHHRTTDLVEGVRSGRIGSILNAVGAGPVSEIQRVAVEESRLGIPVIIGRDVIHGFRTVFPLPLGQAASWNPELVRAGARVAATEAAAAGIHWTFAPMIDIGRDPRWGRVAECLGEDPYLASVLGAAMVEGFQGERLDAPDSIAACAKHFAGYGACEAGKDYASTDLTERALRNIHLPPFRAAVEAGVATLMTSFSDIDGIPASANRFLLTEVLREEWGFEGFVVSDWESIAHLRVHGLTGSDRESAREGAIAGVDMDMASRAYSDHLAALVREGVVPEERVDQMVRNVLRVKFRVGLFDRPFRDPTDLPATANPGHLDAARRAAVESCVLLKNDHHDHRPVLPLDPDRHRRVAVIGPLAEAPAEQLGTWVFDGDPSIARTPLAALREGWGDRVEFDVVETLSTSRDRSHENFEAAAAATEAADVALLFLGEDAILSGEAHCRADISLPGAQEALIHRLSQTGTPLVLVLLTGRPLALESIVESVHSILCAWHPGTMGGPAIADLLFGVESPSGKLPITFPRVTGQVPIYYAEKRTGKPVTPETFVWIDDIPEGATQLSAGNSSFHLDVWYRPMFPFGHGLGYTDFHYEAIERTSDALRPGESIGISIEVVNTGEREATEVVQLYLGDPVASATRPVRELRAFRRETFASGERRRIHFELSEKDLVFWSRRGRMESEPGLFRVWVGGNSDACIETEFELLPRA